MQEEFGQCPHGMCTRFAIRPCPDAEPDVGAALLSGKDPAVAWERAPGRRLPQDDGREIDRLRQVGAHGKTPQNPVRVDQVRRRRDFARGAVRTDHEVGLQGLAGAQPVAADPSLPVQRFVRPPDQGCGPCIDRRRVEHGVEHRPRDRSAMSGVGKPIRRRELHPATARTDDEHVADVTPDRRSQPEIAQHLEAPGPDHVAARLVTREGRFVDQRDPSLRPERAPGRQRCPLGRPRRRARQSGTCSPCSFHHLGSTVRSSHPREECVPTEIAG